MSTRRAKKIIYGALYGILWALVIYVGYLIVRPSSSAAPTPCTLDCPPSGAEPLVAVGKVYAFATSPGHLTFLAQIKNANANYAASNFNYVITLYDGNGRAIGSVSGQSFIYSSQLKYVVVPNVAFAQPVDHAGLAVQDAAWVSKGTLGIIPQFVFENVSSNIAPPNASVSGEITNNDVNSFDRVIVIAVFNGPGGSPIGASATEVDNLGAGETTDFSVIYPAIEGLDPGNSQVFAYALRK